MEHDFLVFAFKKFWDENRDECLTHDFYFQDDRLCMNKNSLDMYVKIFDVLDNP